MIVDCLPSISELALTNALVFTLLAVIAFLTSRIAKSPAIASALWTIAFVKLLTPPILVFPIPIDLGVQSRTQVSYDRMTTSQEVESESLVVSAAMLPPEHRPPAEIMAAPHRRHDQQRGSWNASMIVKCLTSLWLAGSILLGAITVRRIIRFNALTVRTRMIPEWIHQEIEHVSRICGLRKLPLVRLIDLPISPSVGCFGITPTLFLPREVFQSLSQDERRTLLAHEFAHLVRRDHWRAWLEVAAVIGFWWYPLTWIARREWRRVTEDCCDEQVLNWFPHSAVEYAEMLLKCLDVDFPSRQQLPCVSHGTSQFLMTKRRLQMILAHQPAPHPLCKSVSSYGS